MVNIVLLVLGYIPNKAAAGIVGALYVLFGVVLFVNIVRTKSWWGLCLPIGAIASGLGFFIRILLVSHQDSKGIYAISSFLITCMPAFFLAFHYIVYGRLLLHALGSRHSVIRPNIVSTVFILSDVVTFLVQGGGAGLQVTANKRALGRNMFKFGIILQAASYFVFIFFIIWTHIHVKREGIASRRAAWWTVFRVLYVSATGIVIRSIFRLIQVIESQTSVLTSKEVYFYILDALPLLVAIGVFMPWWPAKYIFTDTIVAPEAHKMTRQDRSAAA